MLLCGLAGVAFFARAAAIYSETPSDPQKPVGYIFIALYASLVGGATFGASVCCATSLATQARTSARVACAVAAIALATTAVLLVVHSPK